MERQPLVTPKNPEFLREEARYRYFFNGKIFRAYREGTLKLGLRECAAKLNVSKTYLSRIETDKSETKISSNFAGRLMKLKGK